MRLHREQLEERLRREKPEHSAPAGFTERVMSNLPSESCRDSHPQQLVWPRLAIALALLAIAAVLLPELVSHKSTRSASGPVNGHVSSASTAAEPLAIPTITSEQFQALTVKLDDPLETELNNVISDTRIAIQFVAANFIPSN